MRVDIKNVPDFPLDVAEEEAERGEEVTRLHRLPKWVRKRISRRELVGVWSVGCEWPAVGAASDNRSRAVAAAAD